MYIQELRPTGKINEYQVFYHWIEEESDEIEIATEIDKYKEQKEEPVV